MTTTGGFNDFKGNGPQQCLVFTHGRFSSKSQHSCRRVKTSGDTSLCRECKRFASLEILDRNNRAHDRIVVRVEKGQVGVDHYGRAIGVV